MALRPDEPVAIDAAAGESDLARSALQFAVRCHAGQWRERDGTSYVEHPVEVARLLRDAGGSDVLVAAGLLHDVVASCHVSVVELTGRFGRDVANLVAAVTERPSDESYRERKRALRDQVSNAGRDAALLFAADEITKARELPAKVRSNRERVANSAHGSSVRRRLERMHQTRLEHAHESLDMLQRVVPRHPLVKELAAELGNCTVELDEDAASHAP